MNEQEKVTTSDLAGSDDTDRPLSRDPAQDRATGEHDQLEPLLAGDDAEEYRGRWHDLQASFVDEPHKVVELADQLVAELMQRLAQSFAAERTRLEAQWSRGEEVSTEDLRVALQRYRSFFERLLAT
jgi:hypothetical protein